MLTAVHALTFALRRDVVSLLAIAICKVGVGELENVG